MKTVHTSEVFRPWSKPPYKQNLCTDLPQIRVFTNWFIAPGPISSCFCSLSNNLDFTQHFFSGGNAHHVGSRIKIAREPARVKMSPLIFHLSSGNSAYRSTQVLRQLCQWKLLAPLRLCSQCTASRAVAAWEGGDPFRATVPLPYQGAWDTCWGWGQIPMDWTCDFNFLPQQPWEYLSWWWPVSIFHGESDAR